MDVSVLLINYSEFRFIRKTIQCVLPGFGLRSTDAGAVVVRSNITDLYPNFNPKCDQSQVMQKIEVIKLKKKKHINNPIVIMRK